jgi:hypothetical protein
LNAATASFLLCAFPNISRLNLYPAPEEVVSSSLRHLQIFTHGNERSIQCENLRSLSLTGLMQKSRYLRYRNT